MVVAAAHAGWGKNWYRDTNSIAVTGCAPLHFDIAVNRST